MVFHDLIGDARVVLLGEGAHNIAEFHELRRQLLRALVEEHGFTAFVMESGFPEGLLVDAWIGGAQGRVEDVARDGITYRFGECAPMHRQLTWMRERGVRFYGMDVPGSSTSPGPAVRVLTEDRELRRLSDLGGRTEAAIRYAAMPEGERARLLDALRDLAARGSASDDDVVRHCAASLRAFVAELDPPETGPYPRDAFMAETVRWVLRRERRIVVSAHNAHVGRALVDGRPMLGSLLDPGAVVIGMTYGHGPEVRFTQRSPRPFDCDVALVERQVEPGSLEDRLNGLGLPVAVARLGGEPYDAVVHVRHATRVPGAFERLRAEFEESR